MKHRPNSRPGGARRVGRAGGSLRALHLPVLLAGLLAAGACGRPAADPGVEFPAGWPWSARAAPVSAERGMVVTSDSLASAAGLQVLEAGGNAVDAAVAVQFALAVVHPAAGNIGGGGFLVLRTPEGATAALDFREEAPSGAAADVFLGREGGVSEATWTGHLASGVPGTVAGMAAVHQRHGSLPWARLLEPAVRYAEEGIPVDRELRENVAGEADRLRRFPASAAKWLPGGNPPPVGSTFRQPDLARTLRAIADSGAAAFYSGWIADSLVAEMERGGGLVDRGDLRAYEARWRDPVESGYRGFTLVGMPPPSSGGVTTAEILNILEGFRLDTLGWHTTASVHVMAEAMRRGFGDRNYYLGDPDHVEMPLERLTGQAHADSLAASIRMDTVSASRRFNQVPTAGGESTETTHFSIVDSAGLAVAVTTTINGYFGSGVTVRGAGFVLNNEMDDFTMRPGIPNAYGLVQGEANAVRPGKRMLSSMSPTILVAPSGRTALVTGSPGGATIITTVVQMVTSHVDHGLPVQAAVNAPRFHHQNLPDRIYYEAGGLPDPVVAGLEALGHDVRERDGHSGDVESVFVGSDGTLRGAADPRLGGRALGR